jgi:hypothetical protein
MNDNEEDDFFDGDDDREKKFNSAGDEKKKIINEQEKLFDFSKLVRQRLAIIADAPPESMTSKLLMLDCFDEHTSSIVFNALYPVVIGAKPDVNAEEPREVFVEISLLQDGIPPVNDTLVSLNGYPALPSCVFFTRDCLTQNIFGVVYEKILNVTSHEIYFLNHREEAPDFLQVLKKQIERLHNDSVLLPAFWDEERILFVSKDKMPVFIGCNYVHLWRSHEEYLQGCAENWRAFLNLIVFLENNAPRETINSLEILADEIYEKIEKTAVT